MKACQICFDYAKDLRMKRAGKKAEKTTPAAVDKPARDTVWHQALVQQATILNQILNEVGGPAGCVSAALWDTGKSSSLPTLDMCVVCVGSLGDGGTLSSGDEGSWGRSLLFLLRKPRKVYMCCCSARIPG